MPFLSKKSKKNIEHKLDNNLSESEDLEKILIEKKEVLRRLNLVKNYKSKVNYFFNIR